MELRLIRTPVNIAGEIKCMHIALFIVDGFELVLKQHEAYS